MVFILPSTTVIMVSFTNALSTAYPAAIISAGFVKIIGVVIVASVQL